MLLEEGSQIEGPAGDVLDCILRVQVLELEALGMPRTDAIAAAELHMARIHEALARAGYVVRQVE